MLSSFSTTVVALACLFPSSRAPERVSRCRIDRQENSRANLGLFAKSLLQGKTIAAPYTLQLLEWGKNVARNFQVSPTTS